MATRSRWRLAELDVQRFEQRIADGREQLAHGDAEGAATVLAEGLGLWRGPALAEFSYDAFAQGEIRRLEELRLTAREELIDAELERGRHAQLVPGARGAPGPSIRSASGCAAS